ncbi:LysR family transcriptional regulator [Streptomyces sp. NPDC051572]|uniref:LysR family transcriptional regulator n=1 Tax=unclassified Streptomyces TaxID=2593676 RepID=UPI00344D1F39
MEQSFSRAAPVHSDRLAPLAGLCPDLVRFAAVARLEHLTGAADELGVPQSTVSRGIARVEAAVGTPLFDRERRGLRLNRPGRAFLVRVQRGLGEFAAGYEELRRITDSPGAISFGFLPALGSAPVPLLVKWFREEHPGVRFDFVQDSAANLLEHLRDAEVDLCLTSPLPDESDVTARPLVREPLRLAVPAGHRLAGRGSVRLAEAAAEHFVMASPGYGLHHLVTTLCESAGFTPHAAFHGSEIATIRGFVAAGLGVAVLPPAPEETPGITELPLEDPDAFRTIGLIHAGARTPTPVVVDFAILIARRAQDCFPHSVLA